MKIHKVTLEKEERDQLQVITTKGRHSARKILNALILLNCDEGDYQNRRFKNQEIAAVLKVSDRKINRVKKSFVEDGLEVALNGRQGSRAYAKKADGDFEARLIALCCSDPPDGFSNWSLRLLADQAVKLDYIESVSYETVRRVLKKRNQTMAKKRN